MLLAGGAQAAGKCERLVATGNPEYPPYLWRDPQNPEKLIGATVDLLKAVAEDLGVGIEVIYAGPWSRAQEEVRTGRVDMLAGAFLTVPRLETMDFVHPAFLSTPSVVWVRKGREFPYASWADLQGRTGDTLVNNSFGQAFDAYARDNLTLEGVSSLSQAFQKLLLERTDYVLYERYPGQALASTLGLQDSACNDAWVRGQLAKKMTEFTAAGVPQTLLQRNLQRWKEQQPVPAASVPNQ